MPRGSNRADFSSNGGGSNQGCIIALAVFGCFGMGLAALAIFAAVLFPVFAKAREKARQASCASNEKQLCLGAMMYLQDYDMHYPQQGGAPTRDKLDPYTKTPLVWQCPSQDPTVTNYQFNDALLGHELGKVASPAATVMFFEGGSQTSLVYPHVGGAQVGFADGHVKWFSEPALPALTWDLPAPTPPADKKPAAGTPGATPAGHR